MTKALISLCLALGLHLVYASGAQAQSAATLSIAEGQVNFLRGTATYRAAAGVKLAPGDMIETGPKSQAQIEFGDRLVLNVGAESKLYLLPLAAGKTPDYALAAGWLKAAPMGKGDARELRFLLPGVTLDTSDATLVMHTDAGLDEVFVESGALKATETAHDGAFGKVLSAKGSDYLSRREDQAAALGRPTKLFLDGMPRQYRDNLPLLAAKVKAPAREPAADHDSSFTEVQAWLDANALIRAGLVQRYLPRLKDAEFKAGIVASMATHPEWEQVAGGKASPRKK